MSPRERLHPHQKSVPQITPAELAYWQKIDPGAHVEWITTEKGMEPVICKSALRHELEQNGVIDATFPHNRNGNPVIQIPLPFKNK